MELMELLKTRRTYRRFDQSKSIPDNIVTDILQAQQYASCGGNKQLLRYVVVKTPELVEKVFSLTKWAASLPPEDGTPKDGEHPTMFIVVMAEGNSPDTDAGLAISNMTLAAWNLGVGSCILGNVARVPLKQLLKIDDNMHVHTVVAFGYPTHKSIIKEVNQGENLNYYLDEKRNYVVPRIKVEDVVTFL